jgi:predicted DNA-binding transcriptional regulator YafY
MKTGSETRLTVRLQALLEALRDDPKLLDDLVAQLGSAYPGGDSTRRMIGRDILYLARLGIIVERTRKPSGYRLRGGTPIFTAQELRTLALIRDTFDTRHPQVGQVDALLARLTANLTEPERRHYQRRGAREAPIRPAIDYTPYTQMIEQLEQAIAVRQPVQFRYMPTSRREREHTHVEPYEIEFYERHFYLVGYSALSRQIHDFRIDRIRDLRGHAQRLAPGLERQRPLITFRYRLAAILAQGEISQRFENQRIVERLANGDVIIEAEGRSDFFIIQTLLRYRGNAELLTPDELRAKMVEEVRALAEIYQSDMLQSED